MSARDATYPRKRPAQQRSRDTVEAIVEATARVLSREGLASATTNRVAEVAGVSIGSLYQYFASLDALLAAVAEREAERLLVTLTEAFMGAMHGGAEDMARALVQALLTRYGEDQELHRVLRLEVPFARECEFIGPQLDQAAEALKAWLTVHPELQCRHEDVDLAVFLAVRSCESSVHSLVVYQPDRLADPAVEEQLVDLVLRFLVAERDGPIAIHD